MKCKVIDSYNGSKPNRSGFGSHLRGGKVHVIPFDSLIQQGDAGASLVRRQETAWFPHDMDSIEWMGRDMSKLGTCSGDGVADTLEKAFREPWLDGIKTVERMVEQLRSANLPEPISVRRKPNWSEDWGDFDLDRCRVGDPFWRSTTRVQAAGIQNVTILAQINASAYVSGERMMWRGAVAAALASLLEESGYTVEIVAFAFSERAFRSGDWLLQHTTLKGPGDPLDMGTLVNGMSSWFRRTVGFINYDLVDGQKPSPSYGGAAHMMDGHPLLEEMAADTRAAWLVSNVWDESAAVEFAKEKIEALNRQGGADE